MRRRLQWTTWVLVAFALVVAGCGSSKGTGTATSTATTVAGAPNPNAKEALPPGDIPDNQVYVPYSSASGGYSVKYPQGWAQRQSAGTSTFMQNFNSIAVTSTKASTAPTTASARSSEVAKLRS